MSSSRLSTLKPLARPSHSPWSCAALVMLTGVFPGWVMAMPALEPLPQGETAFRDWQLTLRARQALLEEEALATLNLGVRVRQRVATLWGTVPNLGLSRLAADRLRRVRGLIEVRNELCIAPAETITAETENPLLHLRPTVAEQLFGTTIATTSATLTGRVEAKEQRRPPEPKIPDLPFRPQTTARGPGAVLLAPLSFDAPASLEDKIRDMCRADPRYQKLRPEVRDGTVRLRGTITNWEDLWELARLIARMPDVMRVIVEEVKVP